MMRFLAALVAFHVICLVPSQAAPPIAVAPAAAKSVGGQIYLSANASFSAGGGVTVPFDAAAINDGAICAVTGGSKGVCTPNRPGRYAVSCSALLTATTGPAVNAVTLELQVLKNSAVQASARQYAQVASISAAKASASVPSVFVQMNGTSDTFSCLGYSDATSPVFVGGASALTQMSWQYLGP